MIQNIWEGWTTVYDNILRLATTTYSDTQQTENQIVSKDSDIYKYSEVIYPWHFTYSSGTIFYNGRFQLHNHFLIARQSFSKFFSRARGVEKSIYLEALK